MDHGILTQKVRLQISDYYKRISAILLDTRSYEHRLKTNNARNYLAFVNEGVDSEYSRILQVFYFVVDPNLGLGESTYPFEFLKNDAKEEIEILFYFAKWIVEGTEEVGQVEF